MEKTQKKRKKRRSFRHITLSDRLEIKILLDKDYLQKEVAEAMGFDPSALSREIKVGKGKSQTYCPYRADGHRREKRRHSKYQGMKLEEDQSLKMKVIEALKDYQSPDAIAGRFEKIGKDAIYRWLYSVFGQKYCKCLCTKRYKPKKQKKKTKREMITGRISLDLRPFEGIHAEFDTFVNKKKYKSTACGATITEPQSMLMSNIKIPNLKPKVMTKAINKILEKVNVDDLTGDNGIENRDHQNYTVPTYFADPHAPWQKPHVETNIGLLRKWFIPKIIDIETISQRKLDKYTDVINRKWRRSLGFMSAYEMALSCDIIRSIPSEIKLKIGR